MKLDSHRIVPPSQLSYQPILSPTAGSEGNAATPAVTSAPVDRTTFQSGPATVQTLAKQALAAPEIRQDKVDTLRQSIRNGTHTFNAEAVADAMISSSEPSATQS